MKCLNDWSFGVKAIKSIYYSNLNTLVFTIKGFLWHNGLEARLPLLSIAQSCCNIDNSLPMLVSKNVSMHSEVLSKLSQYVCAGDIILRVSSVEDQKRIHE